MSSTSQLLAWRDAALKALNDSDCAVAIMKESKLASHTLNASLICSTASTLLKSPGFETTDDDAEMIYLRGSHVSGPLVLIVNRFDASERRWPGAHAAAKVLRQAGARVIYYSADGSIDGSLVSVMDGLALFAAADVVICAHGAAEANMIVMRPGASLIEIIPQAS